MTSRKQRRSAVKPASQPPADRLDPFQLQLVRRDYRWRRVLFAWTFSRRQGDPRSYERSDE